ncbi:MAG TPA: FHA domain-containing protein [Alphaproteobacteria bacterium]|nr:FHA domain-containing protein [Alphaproteobacteria bacterium]
MAHLTILENKAEPGAGRIYDLQFDVTTIGREQDNHLVIPDSQISRCHAVLSKTPEGYLLVDNGSTNGIWIGQEKINRRILKEGDAVRMGSHTLIFSDMKKPATPPTSAAPFDGYPVAQTPSSNPNTSITSVVDSIHDDVQAPSQSNLQSNPSDSSPIRFPIDQELNSLLVERGIDLNLNLLRFQRLEAVAVRDPSPFSDLAAACLAPVIFLRNPASLEASFDKTIYHLEQALSKTTPNYEPIIVKMSEEIFERNISNLESRIFETEMQRERQSRQNFISKTFQQIKNIAGEVPRILPAAIDVAVNPNVVSKITTLGENADAITDFVSVALQSSVELMEVCTEFMVTRWEVKKEKEFFYDQLLKVYEKILSSKLSDAIFKYNYGLLRNLFLRHKEQILENAVCRSGLHSALNLMRFDHAEIESQNSALTVTQTLVRRENWGSVIELMPILKARRVGNYEELKRRVLERYKNSISAELKTRFTGAKRGCLCTSVSLMISLVIFLSSIFLTLGSSEYSGGFWEKLGQMISTSFFSFILSIILAAASFLVTFFALWLYKSLSLKRKLMDQYEEFARQIP